MQKYLAKAKALKAKFQLGEFVHVLWEKNIRVDILSRLVSTYPKFGEQ